VGRGHAPVLGDALDVEGRYRDSGRAAGTRRKRLHGRSLAVSDYFGLGPTQVNGGYWSNQTDGALLPDNGGSKYTYYLDLTANVPLKKNFAISAHVGTLKVRNYGELDYTDWKLGVTYNLKGWVFGAAYVDTDADDDWYYTGGSKGNRDTGSATGVVSVGKTF